MFKTKISSFWDVTAFSAEWFAQDLRKFGRPLKWGNYKQDMLEVGCANGFVTRKTTYPYVRNHLNKLLGIDKDNSFIEAAKEDNDIDKIEFCQMDVMDETKLEEMRGRFHKIFVPLVAHLILDNRALLQRFRTMLKPHGQIFLTILVDSASHHAFRTMHKTWTKYPLEELFTYDYTSAPENYFANLATRAGFQVHVCENQKAMDPIEDIPGLTKAILYLYDKIHLMPKDLQEDYHRNFTRIWQEVSPNGFKYERMVCVASKTE